MNEREIERHPPFLDGYPEHVAVEYLEAER
jgi:hypothetical protein